MSSSGAGGFLRFVLEVNRREPGVVTEFPTPRHSEGVCPLAMRRLSANSDRARAQLLAAAGARRGDHSGHRITQFRMAAGGSRAQSVPDAPGVAS